MGPDCDSGMLLGVHASNRSWGWGGWFSGPGTTKGVPLLTSIMIQAVWGPR